MLHPRDLDVRIPDGVSKMTWDEAQAPERHHGIIKFDRIVSICPTFPVAEGRSDRAAMGHALRERVDGGGQILFLNDAPSPIERGVASWLFHEVTGATLDYVDADAKLALKTTSACPAQVAEYLEGIASIVWIRLPQTDELDPPRDSHVVLAGLERPEERPVAVMAFAARGGAWLALPLAERAAGSFDVGPLIPLFNVIERLRRKATHPGAGRPRARSATGKVLSALERAVERGGAFVPSLDTKAVSRLRTTYGFRVESADEARERGEDVHVDVKGHRLRPGTADLDAP